jgi:RNA polymerase sigma-70 factor (ECF subfamily)
MRATSAQKNRRPRQFTTFLQLRNDLTEPLAVRYSRMAFPAVALIPSIPCAPPRHWRTFTDEELIDSYRTNREPATLEDTADELFRRHQLRITRWCYRFTHDRDQAADLSQEILLRAYRNLDKYRGDCRFSTWLYVIARNLCFTAVQKRASEPVWIAKSQSTELPDYGVNVHEAFEMEQSRRSNWRFILETLDQIEARVMLLHYGQELSLSDVSRVLGLTNKSGAKAYIVRARRKLDAAMRPESRRKSQAETSTLRD